MYKIRAKWMGLYTIPLCLFANHYYEQKAYHNYANYAGLDTPHSTVMAMACTMYILLAKSNAIHRTEQSQKPQLPSYSCVERWWNSLLFPQYSWMISTYCTTIPKACKYASCVALVPVLLVGIAFLMWSMCVTPLLWAISVNRIKAAS